MINLTGPQRAAVVVSQLDDERARLLLGSLSETEVIHLMAEVARLPALTTEDVKAVTSHFTHEAYAYVQVRQGGLEVAHRWLQERLGASKAAEVMSELSDIGSDQPLVFLNRAEAGQVAGFLAEEHPQTIALVLAHVNHEHAARIIDRFDEDLATEIVRRMATMSPIPPSTVRRVADELEERLANPLRASGGQVDVAGIPIAAAVLNNVDRTIERRILERIESVDPELAEVIRSEMFVFDDVAQLDDAALQTVLRSIQAKELALALKTATPDIVTKFLSNMSERAADDLREEMQSLGPQRLSTIEAAQAAIVKTVRELADGGTITIGRGNDELIA